MFHRALMRTYATNTEQPGRMNFRGETRHGSGYWGHLISSSTLSPFPPLLSLIHYPSRVVPDSLRPPADSGWELMSELMDQQLDFLGGALATDGTAQSYRRELEDSTERSQLAKRTETQTNTDWKISISKVRRLDFK